MNDRMAIIHTESAGTEANEFRPFWPPGGGRQEARPRSKTATLAALTTNESLCDVLDWRQLNGRP